ncbi:MAG: nitroreductase family protein [Erysipelotrichaceae bacterium]|nr:nitroreductase family protein [Erysipelotrichaceae bacterium]MDY6034024.1 nitroreductase family protein [Bulleidia sp.]
MKELKEILLHRRSVRQFTDEVITKEEMDQVILAGLTSASGRNAKPWRFIVVQNPETIAKMTKFRVGVEAVVKNAKALVIVIGDTSSRTWIEDCSIAMTNMQLMADDIGLGSCWVFGRDCPTETGESSDTYIRNLLHYPENYALEAVLVLGHTSKHPQPYTEDQLAYDHVFYEEYKAQ